MEADLVDCMVALPGQLFYGTAIPACLWFVARDRSGKPTRGGKPLRDRRGEVLFLDARRMGKMVSRVHRELTDEDIAAMAGTYHAWRGEEGAGKYEDLSGFCRSSSADDLMEHSFILTPGRFVGASLREPDSESSREQVLRLATSLRELQAEGRTLDESIVQGLRELGYGD